MSEARSQDGPEAADNDDSFRIFNLDMDGLGTVDESWPPKNEAPPRSYFANSRTSYDLDLAVDMRFEDIVVVKVGSEENCNTFKLPIELLRASSRYCRGATRPDWFDDTTRTISLPTIDPAVFDLYAR